MFKKKYCLIIISSKSYYYKYKLWSKNKKDKKAEIVEDVEKPQKKVKKYQKDEKSNNLFLDTFKQ